MVAPNVHAEIFWPENPISKAAELHRSSILSGKQKSWTTIRTETRLNAHGHLLLTPCGSFRNCHNLACIVTTEQLGLDMSVLYIY
jgi:hypothetical protein